MMEDFLFLMGLVLVVAAMAIIPAKMATSAVEQVHIINFD